MIRNQKCPDCYFADNCLVKNKLKPFSDEAKNDLGVELTFVTCDKFLEKQAEEESTYDEDEE